MSPWQLVTVKDGPRNPLLKFGQMLPGQMLPWQLKSVQNGLRNLPLKFGQNRVSTSQDIAVIEFAGGWVGGGGVQSHFQVKPN